MKLLALAVILATIAAPLPKKSQDVLDVKETNIPILLEREDNVLMMMRITPKAATSFDDITLEFDPGTPYSAIRR